MSASSSAENPEFRTELNRQIFHMLVQGEAARGSGGLVHVKLPSRIQYILTHEINQEKLRESVEELLSDEGSEFMFVVEEEEDEKFHLWKVPRSVLANYEMAMAEQRMSQEESTEDGDAL